MMSGVPFPVAQPGAAHTGVRVNGVYVPASASQEGTGCLPTPEPSCLWEVAPGVREGTVPCVPPQPQAFFCWSCELPSCQLSSPRGLSQVILPEPSPELEATEAFGAQLPPKSHLPRISEEPRLLGFPPRRLAMECRVQGPSAAQEGVGGHYNSGLWSILTQP